MANLTEEEYENLPAYAKPAFVLSGDSYVTVKDAQLKKSIDDLDLKYKSAEKRISDIQASKQAEIDQARKEALDSAVTKGEAAEVERRYKEMMADLERRSGETTAQLQARLDKLTTSAKDDKRDKFLSGITDDLKVFDDCKSIVKRMLAPLIDIDPETGRETILNEDGSASSLSRKDFLLKLENDPAYKRMRQGVATGSGGVATGNNSNGGGAAKKFTDYTGAELSAIRKANPTEYDRLKAELNSTQ